MGGPIFVVGCDRSGTSLLTVLLDHSPDLKMIFEAGFLPRLKRHASDYGDFSRPRHRWYFIRDLQREKATSETFAFDKFDTLTEREAERVLQNAAPTDYPGAADALYSAAARKEGKVRWGEKMPRYVLEVSWLAATFPSSQIVHIIRDPRDVAASIRRAGWKRDVRSAADYWKKRVVRGREQGRSVEDSRYHEVKYETLLQDPIGTLERLAEHLEIRLNSENVTDTESAASETLPESHRDAYPNLFSKLDQPIDPSRARAWKREMSRREVADVESVAASAMKEFGYTVSGSRVPFWIKGMRWLKAKAAPFARWTKRRMVSL